MFWGNIRRKLFELLTLVSVSLALTACGALDKALNAIGTISGPDITTRTVNAIDDATNKLTHESSQWQQVLQELIGKLTHEAQQTIRTDVANIVSRSIAQTGVEFRCNADFIGERVNKALFRLKAKLLNQPMPPVEPGLCQVVPIAVDREAVPDHLKQIEFYGYDFDATTSLKVFLERTSDAPIDVTGKLDRPTHYAMTLKFGENGVRLADDSERFALEWNGKVVSTIGVVQPQTKVCEVIKKPFLPTSVTYNPPLIQDPDTKKPDANYWSNGPEIRVSVKLKTKPNSIDAEVEMFARETKHDWTKVEGTGTFVLYTPAMSNLQGWEIQGLATPSEDTLPTYIDTNDEIESFSRGGSPVAKYEIVGRRPGDDGARQTKVTVYFNPLTVELKEKTGCVAPQAVQQLHKSGLISDRTFNRLGPEVNEMLLREQSTR